MWDEPNVELKCQSTRSSDTIKVIEQVAIEWIVLSGPFLVSRAGDVG